MYRAIAVSYVISPDALAGVSPDPDRAPDRLSARWLLALGSRLIQEVGALLTGSARAGKPVTTFAIDAKARFASAADRAAFADELTQAVTSWSAATTTNTPPAAASTGWSSAAPDPDRHRPGHDRDRYRDRYRDPGRDRHPGCRPSATTEPEAEQEDPR